MNIQQQQSVEKSLTEHLIYFAKACNIAADLRDVTSWERVGYLAECCKKDCEVLDRVAEVQQWGELMTWAYRHAHDARQAGMSISAMNKITQNELRRLVRRAQVSDQETF